MNSRTEDSCTHSSSEEEEINFSVADENENVVEVFEPIPYIFTLKDAFGNSVLYDSEEINNIQVSCPPFYLLLDHVLAVLWILYSGERISVLQTSHLYWALKFLEGLKDDQNKHTPDIEMIIDHLRAILIDVYSQVDLDVLEKQNNEKRNEYSRHLNSSIGKSNKTYSDFKGTLQVCQEKNLMNPTPLKPCYECPASTSAICNSETPCDHEQDQHNTVDDLNILLGCPSYIIQDMLDQDRETLRNILAASFAKDTCPGPNEEQEEEEREEEEEEQECEVLPYNPPTPSQKSSQILDIEQGCFKELCQIKRQLKNIDEAMQNLFQKSFPTK